MNVELILSIVLAISTVFYTIINLMMWFESRASRKLKITPLLIAYLDYTEDHSVLCLYIKNIGEGCAKNVKAKVIKDYNRYGKETYPLSNCYIFKNGFNLFPPLYQIKYYISNPSEIDFSSGDSYIEIELEYNDIYDNKAEVQKFNLAFNQIIDNYSNPPETYIGQISYYLQKVSQSLEKSLKK